MSITVSNPQNTNSVSSVSSLTLTSYTVPAGSDKILVVGADWKENGTHIVTVSSVTHNGVALTERGAKVGGGSGVFSSGAWDLQLGSTTPTGDIVITWSAAVIYSCALTAVTLTGAAQQAPEATQSNTSAISSISTSITTVSANAIVVDTVVTNKNVMSTSGTGQTSDIAVSNAGGSQIGYAASHTLTTTAGSYTLGWTGGSGGCATWLLAYAPAGGGGTNEPVGPGSLHLTGIAPNTSRFGGHTAEAVPSGALHLTSYAPGTFQPYIRRPVPSSNIRLTGVVPAFSKSALNSKNEPVPNGALTLTGFAPSTSRFGGHIEELVPSGTLRITGFAPGTFIPFINRPVGKGTLTLTGFAPGTGITVPHGVSIPIPNNVIQFRSYAPEIGPKKVSRGGGLPVKRQLKRIILDGALYEIEERQLPYYFYEYLSRLHTQLEQMETAEDTKENRKRKRILRAKYTKTKKKYEAVLGMAIEDEDELILMMIA